MSMSEFEECSSGSSNEDRPSPLTPGESEFPDDFSDEDMEFAQELDALFSLDNEEVPPLYAQTLLASENPHLQPVEDGFEAKTRARVFRRLKLRRRIFKTHGSPLQAMTNALPARRTLMTISTICMLILAITVASTGNAFASGLTFLLSGTHSGVLLLDGYPKSLASTPRPRLTQALPAFQPGQKQIDLWDVNRYLHFPMYLPDSGSLPPNYAPSKIFLDDSAATQSWADGPVMELEYTYSSPGAEPSGSGVVAIAEFKPMGQVMEAVQQNSAHQLEINSDGDDQAIYINGQWKKIANSSSYQWVYGQSSQLIYEQDGVIFWIVGDQRDGFDGNTLLKIATSLAAVRLNDTRHIGNHFVGEVLQGKSSDLFDGDIIYVDNPNNSDGPTLKVVGTESSANPQGISHVESSLPHAV